MQTFTKTAFVDDIKLLTSGNVDLTNSARRCRPCAKHVKCNMFGYNTFKASAAAIIYAAASVVKRRTFEY